MPPRISALSTVYLRVPVTATAAGNPLVVTGDRVAFAFTLVGIQPTTWYAGDWEGQSARVLIGPNGVTQFTPREYWVWLKVTDSPEILAEQVDTLSVY